MHQVLHNETGLFNVKIKEITNMMHSFNLSYVDEEINKNEKQCIKALSKLFKGETPNVHKCWNSYFNL